MNLKDPTDISYVFGGAYSPLTVKIVEYVSDHQNVHLGLWLKSLLRILRQLGGFSELQPHRSEDLWFKSSDISICFLQSVQQKKVIKLG